MKLKEFLLKKIYTGNLVFIRNKYNIVLLHKDVFFVDINDSLLEKEIKSYELNRYMVMPDVDGIDRPILVTFVYVNDLEPLIELKTNAGVNEDQVRIYKKLFENINSHSNTLRTCLVNDEKALFHRWIEKDKVMYKSNMYIEKKELLSLICDYTKNGILASPGITGEVIKQTLGIVELEDGTILEVEPSAIDFNDGIFEKVYKEEKK